MLVDQQLDESGALSLLYLRPCPDGFHFCRGEEQIVLLSAAILETVCRRYSRPLEEGLFKSPKDSLAIKPGLQLCSWQYRAPVDLEEKRYLVLLEAQSAPLAVLARQITSALHFLSNATALSSNKA